MTSSTGETSNEIYAINHAFNAAYEFELATGELVLSALQAQGFSDSQIDHMIQDGTAMTHVPDVTETIAENVKKLNPSTQRFLQVLAWGPRPDLGDTNE